MSELLFNSLAIDRCVRLMLVFKGVSPDIGEPQKERLPFGFRLKQHPKGYHKK